MSRKIQRFVAAMLTAAALLLVVPAPSWAAQVHNPAADPSLGLLAQAWFWLESLLTEGKAPALQKTKTTTTTTTTTTTVTQQPPGQGPAIDPNGAP